MPLEHSLLDEAIAVKLDEYGVVFRRTKALEVSGKRFSSGSCMNMSSSIWTENRLPNERTEMKLSMYSALKTKSFLQMLDYAGCHDTRRSTLVQSFSWDIDLISWSSIKKQEKYRHLTTVVDTSPYQDVCSNTRALKHIDIRDHFIKEQVEGKKFVELYFVETKIPTGRLFYEGITRRALANSNSHCLELKQMSTENSEGKLQDESVSG
ncbi:hypothetical protein Tco_0955811 [Tanacetum coccineum]|uniref:Uncharacterized protein n=1 Tax=Tanacetum coccineum TaxID=301880 RepID=A0ABQ5E8E0_9ASTR